MSPDQQQQQQQEQEQEQERSADNLQQSIERLYFQTQVWIERLQIRFDSLLKYQYITNKTHHEAVAKVKADLQLAESDISLLKSTIRSQDERIDELRSKIDRDRSVFRNQGEVISSVREQRRALMRFQESLQDQTAKLDSELAVMSLRLETMDRRLSRLKRECDGDRDVSDGSDTKTERELRDELMEGILAMFDTLQSMPLVTNTPPTEQQAVSCTEQGVNYTEPAVNHAEQDVNHAEHNHIEQDVDQTTPSSPSHTRSSSVSSSSISDTPTTPFNTIANASSETPTTTTTTAISSSPKDAPLVPLSPSSPAPPLIPTILLHSLPPLLGLDMGLDAYNKALVYFTRVVEAFNNFIFSMILLLVFSLALEILLYQQQQQHDPDGLSDSMSIYNSVQLKDDTQSFGLIQFLRYLAGNLVWRKEDFIPT